MLLREQGIVPTPLAPAATAATAAAATAAAGRGGRGPGGGGAGGSGGGSGTAGRRDGAGHLQNLHHHSFANPSITTPPPHRDVSHDGGRLQPGESCRQSEPPRGGLAGLCEAAPAQCARRRDSEDDFEGKALGSVMSVSIIFRNGH
jgi:hypothetical protein